MSPRILSALCLLGVTLLGCAPLRPGFTPETHVAPSLGAETPAASNVHTHFETPAERPGGFAGLTLGFGTRWTPAESATWRAGLDLGLERGGKLVRGTLGWGTVLAEDEGTTFSAWMSAQVSANHRYYESNDSDERYIWLARAAFYGGVELGYSGESGAVSLAVAPGFGDDVAGAWGGSADGLLSIRGRTSMGPEDLRLGLELGANLPAGERSKSSLLVGVFLAWSWGKGAHARPTPVPAPRSEAAPEEPTPRPERAPLDERPRGRRREE
jgi:hypothetical protein